MNILITGSAGFIASHIVEELLKSNKNKIFGLDNFSSGTKKNIKFIESIDQEKKFHFQEADIRDFNTINKIIKENNIEQIYHLAALVSVQESILDPLYSNDVNVKGTLNILEAARLNHVKRVVFSSSAAAYGDEPTQPKSESSIVKPISPYGYNKLIGEQYMKLYSDLYGIETVSLRYFNVYGPRQSAISDYSGVISIFENKFYNNETVNIYGDGKQYRDFIYVKDVVRANILAMNTLNLSNETICVGTGVKTSINKLFNLLNKKYKKDFKPIYLNERQGDIKESVCENSKIKELLGLKSFTKFKDGVMKL